MTKASIIDDQIWKAIQMLKDKEVPEPYKIVMNKELFDEIKKHWILETKKDGCAYVRGYKFIVEPGLPYSFCVMEDDRPYDKDKSVRAYVVENSYDAIEAATKSYWEDHYPQDVVAFFYQKHSHEDEWEWCEELVECCGIDDYKNMTFLSDFCEGQTDVKDITIVPLRDVTHYYAEHQIQKKDVVEVVRCKDCEYNVTNELEDKEKLPYFCTVHQEQFYDLEEYCSFGNRKENDVDLN